MMGEPVVITFIVVVGVVLLAVISHDYKDN